jgi:hypothetical protein
MVAGELSLTHATAHTRAAIWEMTRGRYRSFFWAGIILSALGGVLPVIVLAGQLPIMEGVPLIAPAVAVGATPLALLGLALYEHAYVQAGQSVPLA